jgi:hypothetical protein
MVEVLSCIKDRELADLHKQHKVEKETKELEVAFESLYLDDEQETVSGIKRKEQERVEVTRNMTHDLCNGL